MLQYKTKRIINLNDWNKLVVEIYKKPYNFQQQEGCQSRGIFNITIPTIYTDDEEMNDDIPEEINGEEMGVKFSKWLSRDPSQPILGENHSWSINLFWERNFYPDVYTVANDLYAKGLIEAGDYIIEIDW